jgi:lipoprotein-releasing system permease protein
MIKNFYLTATVDLGQYQFNSRYIFVDLPVVQELLGTNKISGLRFKLKSSDKAPEWATKVQEKIGWSYAAIDWKQTNRNFFSAVEYEKMVMFFVVFIIVIAACFNVTTTLFVTVLKRYRDISLMKTLGARPLDIAGIFCLHGLFLGVIGVVIGITSGVFFCFVFEFLQKAFPLLPADIYRLSFVATEIRVYDLLIISGATLLLCFFSTLIPSIRGSFLSPVQ